MNDNFKHLKINYNEIPFFCNQLIPYIESNHIGKSVDFIQEKLNKIDNNTKIRLLLIGNAINFSFWNTSYLDTYEKNGIKGSLAMWNIVLTNPIFKSNNGLKKVIDSSFKQIFGEIPMENERKKSLKEVLNFLEKQKDLTTWLDNFKVGDDLISYLIKIFPMFKDNQNGINFNKRATCFVYMLSRYCIHNFDCMGKTYILADYQIPKLFYNQKIIEYDKKLEFKINNNIKLPTDSREEFEIRFATVIIGEKILCILNEMGIDINSNILDKLLWEKAKKINAPYHLVRTVKY